jgi:hypothetical protein
MAIAGSLAEPLNIAFTETFSLVATTGVENPSRTMAAEE